MEIKELRLERVFSRIQQARNIEVSVKNTIRWE